MLLLIFKFLCHMSPPTRRCGLKFDDLSHVNHIRVVTSYAEVWIEIIPC